MGRIIEEIEKPIIYSVLVKFKDGHSEHHARDERPFPAKSDEAAGIGCNRLRRHHFPHGGGYDNARVQNSVSTICGL